MSVQRLLLCAFALIFVAGCAPTQRYSWSNYDSKLYQHYKNPTEYDQFIENLKEVIDKGEEANRVPPGIYAEYGFALYERSRFSEAVIYFKLENDKWPESRVLMEKMIQNAQMHGKKDKLPNQVVVPISSEASSAVSSEVKGGTK